MHFDLKRKNKKLLAWSAMFQKFYKIISLYDKIWSLDCKWTTNTIMQHNLEFMKVSYEVFISKQLE